jgi:YVTN family beta-propeller protein
MNRPTYSVARFGAYLLAGATLAGCGQASVATSSNNTPTGPEALVFVGNSANGTVSVISHGHDGNSVLNTIPVGSGAVGDINISSERHVFVNVTANNQVAAIDPVVTGDPVLKNFLSVGQKPVHGYRDPSDGTLIWVLNDAPATSGPCLTAQGGAATGSVTVIQNHEVDGGGGGGSGNGQPTLGILLEEICVGRGHHKAAFSYPSLTHPNVPRRAFVSNISDGTVTVIDADPALATFGDVIATVDLCDPAKRTCDSDLTTNSGAVPHGIDYSPVSGLIYNANVGYGTVWAIDPITPALFDVDSSTPEIDPINVGFANKAHVSPDGRFLVVKGTDTASDPDHVLGRLSVVDLSDHSVHPIDLTDIHPDSFEFSPDGSKLYVTTATSVASGNTTQLPNLKNNVLLSFDASGLPQLSAPIEIPVGVAGHDHRSLAIHEHNGVAEHVWVPNPDDGTVSVVDADSDTVVDTVTVGGEPSSIAVLGIE